jgi:hypothetical protein
VEDLEAALEQFRLIAADLNDTSESAQVYNELSDYEALARVFG